MLGMRIAKPILLVTTPVGLGLGLYEAYRLAGGLVLLMAAMIATIGAAMASVVGTIRREEAALRSQAASRQLASPGSPDSQGSSHEHA
jgi:hypothetical protein